MIKVLLCSLYEVLSVNLFIVMMRRVYGKKILIVIATWWPYGSAISYVFITSNV